MEELSTVYDAIQNDLGLEASFRTITSILETLEGEYYQGKTLDTLNDYIKPEFLIKVAEEIFTECKNNNYILDKNQVSTEVWDEIKNTYSWKELYNRGLINVDEDRVIENEINNGSALEVSYEYFYGDVKAQIELLESQWDSMDDEDRYNYLLDFAAEDVNEYVEDNIEELQEKYGEDFDWEQASYSTKLEILLQSDLLEFRSEELHYELSDKNYDVSEEAKYYVCDKMADMLVGRDYVIESSLDSLFYACDRQDSTALCLIDVNDEKVFEYATDDDQYGSSEYYLTIDKGQYLHAEKVSTGWDESENTDKIISRVFIETYPGIKDKVDPDYIINNKEDLQKILNAVNLEKVLPQKITKAQKLSDHIESEDFTYKPATTQTSRTKL